MQTDRPVTLPRSHSLSAGWSLCSSLSALQLQLQLQQVDFWVLPKNPQKRLSLVFILLQITYFRFVFCYMSGFNKSWLFTMPFYAFIFISAIYHYNIKTFYHAFIM